MQCNSSLGSRHVCACRAGITAAQAQLDIFQQQAPTYPKTLFQGRGIVIMAGGLTYFVPAWINVHMLRKTGTNQVCQCLSNQLLTGTGGI